MATSRDEIEARGPLVLRPAPSSGPLWLAGVGTAAIFVIMVPGLAEPGAFPVLTIIAALVGVPFLAFAAWLPSMRYELDDVTLTLRCGPLLRYRIALDDVRRIDRRDLAISLWASLRLPGVALFTVGYRDVGRVKMCATRASQGILLIHTSTDRYGVTPADEGVFVGALQTRGVLSAGDRVARAPPSRSP